MKTLSTTTKQQLYTQLCEKSEEAIFILNHEFRYVDANRSFEQLMGISRTALIGRHLSLYDMSLFPDAEREMMEGIINTLNTTHHFQDEIEFDTRAGYRLKLNLTIFRTIDDGTTYYLGLFRDVKMVNDHHGEVTYLLNHDDVTGLPTRQFFLSQFSDLLLDSYQELVLVRLNIDRYRLLKNMLSAEALNKILKQFVKRIKSLNLEHLVFFSRFGGDDFAMLFEVSDANIIRRQFERLMQLTELPFVANGDSFYLHFSAGVSFFPKHGSQVDILLNNAEKALQHVKLQGGDDISWYDPTLHAASAFSLQLEAELRQGIEESQFVPLFQPKISLKSGETVGFEALVRWQHPTKGLLSPAKFINAIIDHKLSFELFCQMAKKIAEQQIIWRQLGLNCPICINADAAEFKHPQFIPFIQSLLAEYDLPASLLHIEMTESSLMSSQKTVKQKLLILKEMGVRLALDDFGTGYASLSYLKDYPFDFIKIDQVFIKEIVDNPKQQYIVKAIMDMALALDYHTIAEGIETDAQRQLMCQLGCEYAQGYLFSKPLNSDDATVRLLNQQKHSRA